MLRVLLVFLLLTTTATAGPWPRAEGEGFLSFSFDADAETGENGFLSFYIEYGLSEGRTFGLDRRESSGEIAKTVAFIRYPVQALQGEWKLAYELGLGIVDDHAALRPGVSVGRGFSLGKRTGWFTIDARALILDDPYDSLLETDVTFGLNATDKAKFILQLQAGTPTVGDTYGKLAPSLVIRQNDSRHLVFGVTAGIWENDDLKVNLGLWQDF